MGELLHGQGESPVRSRDRVRFDLPAGKPGFIPIFVEAEIGTLQPLEYQGTGPPEGKFPCASLPGFHGLMLFAVLLHVQTHALVSLRHQEGGRGEGKAHIAVPGEKDELVRLPLHHIGHASSLIRGIQVDELIAVPRPDRSAMEGGDGHGGRTIGIGPDGNTEPGASALEKAAHRREKALYVSEEGISFCHCFDRLSFYFLSISYRSSVPVSTRKARAPEWRTGFMCKCETGDGLSPSACSGRNTPAPA